MSRRATGRGQIITFYSYKGGTGRTMALANAACLVAATPREEQPRILMMDWDLEAPGLHKYFHGLLRNVRGDVDTSPGVIDLFEQLRKEIDPDRDQPLSEEHTERLIAAVDLKRYVQSTDIRGVDLMTAGVFDEKYATRVNTFRWEDLFHGAPTLFRALSDRLSQIYDYVFIDSRTGLTDISGICTMLMPDKLAVVFTPNRQSLTGIADLVRRAIRYRRDADDLRPLSVFPLPSRIDATEPDLRKQWRFGDKKSEIEGYEPHFEALFQEVYALPRCELHDYFNDVQIQHVPKYAYGEELAVRSEDPGDRLSIARSYANFSNRLVGSASPWTPLTAFPKSAGAVKERLKRYLVGLDFFRRHAAAFAMTFFALLLSSSIYFVILTAQSRQLAEQQAKVAEYRAREVEERVVRLRMELERCRERGR